MCWNTCPRDGAWIARRLDIYKFFLTSIEGQLVLQVADLKNVDCIAVERDIEE